MMIRWTFHFNDTPINVTTVDEKEDARIAGAMLTPDELFYVNVECLSLFMNLRQCTMIVRKILTEKEIEEIKAQTAPKMPEPKMPVQDFAEKARKKRPGKT